MKEPQVEREFKICEKHKGYKKLLCWNTYEQKHASGRLLSRLAGHKRLLALKEGFSHMVLPSKTFCPPYQMITLLHLKYFQCPIMQVAGFRVRWLLEHSQQGQRRLPTAPAGPGAAPRSRRHPDSTSSGGSSLKAARLSSRNGLRKTSRLP